MTRQIEYFPDLLDLWPVSIWEKSPTTKFGKGRSFQKHFKGSMDEPSVDHIWSGAIGEQLRASRWCGVQNSARVVAPWWAVLCHGVSLRCCQSQSGVKWKHLSPPIKAAPCSSVLAAASIQRHLEWSFTPLLYMARMFVKGHSKLLCVTVRVFTCNLDHQSIALIRF